MIFFLQVFDFYIKSFDIFPFTEKKKQLSEVDQQMQKAEAAQRRKVQNEKAARELEVLLPPLLLFLIFCVH